MSMTTIWWATVDILADVTERPKKAKTEMPLRHRWCHKGTSTDVASCVVSEILYLAYSAVNIFHNSSNTFSGRCHHPPSPGHPCSALCLAIDFLTHCSGYFPLRCIEGRNSVNVSTIPYTDPLWCPCAQHPLHGLNPDAHTLSTSKRKKTPQSDWGNKSMVVVTPWVSLDG